MKALYLKGCSLEIDTSRSLVCTACAPVTLLRPAERHSLRQKQAARLEMSVLGMDHMELIVVVLALIGAYAIWKFFFRPNTFDKLSLLSLGVWKSQYAQATFFAKTGMASALIVQAVSVSEQLGSGVTLAEFRAMMKAENVEVNHFVCEWFDLIESELSEHLGGGQADQLPAAVAFGWALLKASNPERFRQVIASPELMTAAFSR